MNDKTIHPAASILPLMVGDEFAALILDIRAHGLRHPIVLHPDGSILDGRNRYRACQKAGVDLKFETWTGALGTEVAFVISENIHRRHLTVDQRAMYFAQFANLGHGERPNHSVPGNTLTIAQAAKAADVSESTIRRARQVLQAGDEEMVQAVERGEMPVKKAAEQIGERRDKRGRLINERAVAQRVETTREMARHWKRLNDAIDALNSLPDPDDFLAMGRGPKIIKRIQTTIDWLTDFQEKWSRHESSRKQSSAA